MNTGKISTLDWEVQEAAVMVNDIKSDQYKAIVRSDNHKILNICKKRYTALSNQMFKDTVYKLAEFSGLPVEKMIEFKGGKVVLAFLKNPEHLQIADWQSEDYMVMGNSHDSSFGFFTGTSNVVIRCMNSFSAISRMNTIYHTSSIETKIDDLILYYKNYIFEKDRMKQTFEKWADIRVTAEDIDKFPDLLLDATENSKTKKKNQVAKLSASIAREIAAMGDNYYGLFNGVTHYTTHVKEIKYPVFGNVIGSNANLNKKAYSLINELVLN